MMNSLVFYMAVAAAVSSCLLHSPTEAFAPFGVTVRKSFDFALMAKNNNNRGRVVEVKPIMNEECPSGDLRVVTPNPKGKDEPLGIMTRAEALEKAQELGGLDLILVNPSSDPPVCKIVDYSKYRYMQTKKAKEVKKNSKATEIKEVKMSYKIDVHDYDVRKNNASKFLTQGNRVKCTVQFRGREAQHDRLGFELLDKLSEDLGDVCMREGKAKREGRNISLILSPKPEVMKAVNENRRAEEKAKKKKKLQNKESKAAAAIAAAEAAGAAALAAGAANGSLGVNGSNPLDDDDDDDDSDDLVNSLESSLDELFGTDNLTDDLFS